MAHGQASTNGTDLSRAIQFSDVSGSNESSLGLLRTGGRYVGIWGPSLRLEGLEPGFDDNVCRRAIVLHPWSAVEQAYVDRCGYAAPSLGCPAIDDTIFMPIRERLARPTGAPLDEGVLLLLWYPDSSWHPMSEYLNATTPSSTLQNQLTVKCQAGQMGTPTPPTQDEYACS